jgi:hypothetical protein
MFRESFGGGRHSDSGSREAGAILDTVG